MSSLVKIANELKSIDSYEGVVTKQPYLELETHLKDMSFMCRNIEAKVREEKSFLYKSYCKLKGYFARSEQKSIEELFDIQLENINYLNICLDSINYKAREELSNIEDYSNSIASMFKKSLSDVQEKKEVFEKDIIRVQELKEKADSSGISFDIEEELKIIKRRIKENKHEYVLNNDNVIDLWKERYVIGAVEDFLRCSIHVSERMAEKTRRVARHLSVTKKGYSTLYQQQKSIFHLSNALNIIKDYTQQVQNILGSGLNEMDSILNNSFDNFYEQNFVELNGSLSTHKMLVKDIENERKINKFIEG